MQIPYVNNCKCIGLGHQLIEGPPVPDRGQIDRKNFEMINLIFVLLRSIGDVIVYDSQIMQGVKRSIGGRKIVLVRLNSALFDTKQFFRAYRSPRRCHIWNFEPIQISNFARKFIFFICQKQDFFHFYFRAKFQTKNSFQGRKWNLFILNQNFGKLNFRKFWLNARM